MDRKVIIIAGVTLIVVLCFYIFFQNDGKTYNWVENYTADSKNPYGLYIVNELLKDYNSDALAIVDRDFSNLDTTTQHQNYVVVNQAVKYDSLEMETLLSFVKNGNTAFLSTKSFPRDLALRIFPQRCDDHSWTDYIFANDSLSTLNVSHVNLADSMGFDYRFLYFHKPVDYNWNYIDLDYFCDAPYSPHKLGLIDNYYPNFARQPYGDGYFYLHTTPLAFTNIQLLDEQGLAYASKVFTHLNKGKIYVDHSHGISNALSRKLNDEGDYIGRSIDEGPLQFLFRNPSLKWGWLLLLFTGLLFLLFRTRRKQRVIPILESPKNTSLEFISTIGSLYFLQKDNARLATQMAQLFFGYIRQKYDLPTHDLDDRFTDKLNGKSEIPKSHLSDILSSWGRLKSATSVPDTDLIAFHKLLSYFYTNCK